MRHKDLGDKISGIANAIDAKLGDGSAIAIVTIDYEVVRNMKNSSMKNYVNVDGKVYY